MKTTRMGLGRAALFVCAVLSWPHAVADDTIGGGSGSDWGWNATFENDVFFGSDRNYTNGVQLERVELGRGVPGEGWLSACGLVGCGDHRWVTTHHRIGQLMYTPENIEVVAPQPLDRPWAGLLYYAYERAFLDDEGRILTRLIGQFGVIGPAAFSKDTQTLVHRIIDSPKPLGWGNQSGNELVGLAMVDRKWALSGLEYNGKNGFQSRSAGSWRVAVGTLMTFAGAGFETTVGTNLPTLVSLPGIEIKNYPPLMATMGNAAGQGSQTTALADRRGQCLVDWLDCSLTLGIEGRLMAHNVFLDGPVFRSGPKVDSKRFVADASLTVRLTFPRSASKSGGPWYASFKATRRTAEFKSRANVGGHTFGALTVGRLVH